MTADITKTGDPRKVDIQPNLRAWLERYPTSKHPIIFSGFQKANMRIRKQFQLTGRHDVLRHTFASMFVGKFRSVAEAALQSGNSERIIKRHYLDAVDLEVAVPFWKIRSKRKARPR